MKWIETTIHNMSSSNFDPPPANLSFPAVFGRGGKKSFTKILCKGRELKMIFNHMYFYYVSTYGQTRSSRGLPVSLFSPKYENQVQDTVFHFDYSLTLFGQWFLKNWQQKFNVSQVTSFPFYYTHHSWVCSVLYRRGEGMMGSLAGIPWSLSSL